MGRAERTDLIFYTFDAFVKRFKDIMRPPRIPLYNENVMHALTYAFRCYKVQFQTKFEDAQPLMKQVNHIDSEYFR